MLKFYFAICMSLTLVFANAQSNQALPFPVRGKWVYYNIAGCFEHFQMYDTTLIDNVPFNSGWYEFEYCDGSIVHAGCFSQYAYIRSEGNIWYTAGGLTSTFFNWDGQEGDSIWYDGMLGQNNQFIISNIDTITTVDNVNRRTYHFVYAFDGATVPYYYNKEVYMIEGIGCSVLGLDRDGIEDHLFLLSCFYDENGLLIYHQDYEDWNIYGCCNIPESVEKIELMSMQLFPSPASDHITLQFGNGPLPTEVKIFNSLGALVQIEAVNGRQQLQLNTSNFASGVYTVVAQSSTGAVVEKFVKE